VKTRLAELASEVNTTDRTLRRAVRQGLLRAHRLSPRTLDLPLAERAYLRRTWPFLAAVREALRTEPSVSLAVLFGSRARGDEHASSDIDLLVQLRGGTNARQLASRLSGRLGHPVQLVLLEDAERTPLLLSEVLNEGRVLVDRDETWPSLMDQRSKIERARRKAERQIDSEFETAFGPGRTQ
jgi:predicted nucleotidyltransferase